MKPSNIGTAKLRTGWVVPCLIGLYLLCMIGLSNAFFWSLDKDEEEGIRNGWSKRTRVLFCSPFVFSSVAMPLLLIRLGLLQGKPKSE